MICDRQQFPTMKMGGKFRKFRNYWQIRLIEARYIGGFVGTNNQARLMLCPKSGRLRRGRTKRLVNLVKKQLDSEVHRKSIRTMANDFKSTFGTIRRVLTEDLGKKCYRKINVQKLEQDQKPIRNRAAYGSGRISMPIN